MTIESRELSRDDSRPFQAVLFQKDLEAWRYCTAATPQLVDGQTYEPLPGMKVSPQEQNSEDLAMKVTITMPRDVGIADQVRGFGSPAPIAVTVFACQHGDSDRAVTFLGELAGGKFEKGLLQVLCTTEQAAFGDSLGRTYYQLTCPYMLYDEMCGLEAEDFTEPGVISSIAPDRLTLVLVGPPHLEDGSDWYAGGFLRLATGKPVWIRDQDGDELTLLSPLDGGVASAEILVTAGCDRLVATCNEKFDNVERFGGYPLMPQRDPWKRIS